MQDSDYNVVGLGWLVNIAPVFNNKTGLKSIEYRQLIATVGQDGELHFGSNNTYFNFN